MAQWIPGLRLPRKIASLFFRDGASRNDGRNRHASPSPRRLSARVMPNPSAQRAWGMPGAKRTRSLACKSVESTRVSHHEYARSPGIPAREWF
jgi:hypothetical protein